MLVPGAGKAGGGGAGGRGRLTCESQGGMWAAEMMVKSGREAGERRGKGQDQKLVGSGETVCKSSAVQCSG